MPGSEPEKRKLTFYDLPKEIRLQILGETDLVIPIGKFWWTDSYSVDYSSSRFFLRNTKDSRCIACTAPKISWPLSCENHENKYCSDCMILLDAWYCPQTHAANLVRTEVWNEGCNCTSCRPLMERKCSCIKFPTNLFPVSKLVRAEAYEVLFMQTRFSLRCRTSRKLRWLKSLPSDVLKHIRKLDLVLSDVETRPSRWFKQRTPRKLSRKWAELVNFIANHLDVSKLSLCFTFLTVPAMCSDADKKKTLLYMRKPLSQLRQVKQFFMFIDGSYPWANELEAGVEKAVKGREYDSLKTGKIVNGSRYTIPGTAGT